MNAFRRAGRRFYETKVPRVNDEGVVVWDRFPCETVDGRTARAMDRMISALGKQGAKAWDLLGAVTGEPQRWSLDELYRRWTAVPSKRADRNGKPIAADNHERIEALREQLEDVDVEPFVEKFENAMKSPSVGISADTAAHYRAAVRLFIPKGKPFLRSQLNEGELRDWLEEMDDVKPGTVRKRGIGMGRFTGWLKEKRVLGADPMRDVTLPAQDDPLSHYLDTPDLIRLADSLPGQMRHFEYLLPGCALEVSTALAIRVRAVSETDREIHAPGTKTYNRNRIVKVADFAWDAVKELIKGKTPDSLLVDQIPHRWRARDDHAAAVVALGALGHPIYVEWEGQKKLYTLRDHRHSWAVRAVRSGWPIHAVAAQLGHGDGGVLAFRVYGRHSPNQEERARWEALSTARDVVIAAELQKRNLHLG